MADVRHSINDNSSVRLSIKPYRMAALTAGVYLVSGLVYIYTSSKIAAYSSLSKEQLENLEIIKGYAFIFVTAVLLFTVLFFLFQRLHRREVEIEKQRDAIAASGRQAVAGLFASSIAHDLNNILSVSYYEMDLLLESDELKAPDREHVVKLRQANDQIRDYVNRMAEVSGRHLLSGRQRTDLTAVVDAALKLAGSHKKVNGCSIETDMPESLLADIDEALIHRALLNLVINAADATGGRGRIVVRLSGNHERIRLEVHDDGPGIPQDVRDLVLEPFYTTKPDGTGLGLLSVRHCADVHEGIFRIEASPLGGTCVYLDLPSGAAQHAVLPSSR